MVSKFPTNTSSSIVTSNTWKPAILSQTVLVFFTYNILDDLSHSWHQISVILQNQLKCVRKGNTEYPFPSLNHLKDWFCNQPFKLEAGHKVKALCCWQHGMREDLCLSFPSRQKQTDPPLRRHIRTVIDIMPLVAFSAAVFWTLHSVLVRQRMPKASTLKRSFRVQTIRNFGRDRELTRCPHDERWTWTWQAFGPITVTSLLKPKVSLCLTLTHWCRQAWVRTHTLSSLIPRPICCTAPVSLMSPNNIISLSTFPLLVSRTHTLCSHLVWHK